MADLNLRLRGDFEMANILTGKARIEQIQSRLWMTIDNQLVELDNGELLIAPRYLVTDNNTNPFGDNDLSDVRASHFHDIGCAYHQLIYVNKTREELLSQRYLRPRACKIGRFISVLEDLPLEFLEVRKCGYGEVNDIFRQILKASGEGKSLVNLMYIAVWNNISYFFKRPVGLDKNILFRKEYGNVKDIRRG